MIYNKLVRDGIPEIIARNGGIPSVHVANDEEYNRRLKEKLAEEIAEFEVDENIEELADILEVIDAIIEFKGFNREELDKVKSLKALDRGRFLKRIILEETVGPA